MFKTLRILNFLGGALFSWSTLTFVSSEFMIHKSYLASTFVSYQPGVDGLAAQDKYNQDFERERAWQLKMIFVASIGAGLACLRE